MFAYDATVEGSRMSGPQPPQPPSGSLPSWSPPPAYPRPQALAHVLSSPVGSPVLEPPAPVPSPPPPQQRRGRLGWIVGGVATAGAVTTLIILALTTPRDAAPAAARAVYTAENVRNACDLIDVGVLDRWAPNPDRTPSHNERKPSELLGGGGADCSASSSASGRTVATARLRMDAAIADKYGATVYQAWSESEAGRTGAGRTLGDVPGLGERAFFAVDEDKTDYSHRVDYTVAAQDDNLSVKVNISVFVDERTRLDPDAIRQACIDQVRSVMTGMRAPAPR